jgi:hypothetical protein
VLTGAVSGTFSGEAALQDHGVPHPQFTLTSDGYPATDAWIAAQGGVPGDPNIMLGEYRAAVTFKQGSNTWSLAPGVYGTLKVMSAGLGPTDMDENAWLVHGTLDAALLSDGMPGAVVNLHAEF